jgi:hypothetical protein
MNELVLLWFLGSVIVLIVDSSIFQDFLRHSYLNEIFGGCNIPSLFTIPLLNFSIYWKLRGRYNLVPLEKLVNNERLNLWLMHPIKNISFDPPPVWIVFLVIPVFLWYLLALFIPGRHHNLMRVFTQMVYCFLISVLIQIPRNSVHLVNAKLPMALVLVHSWFNKLFGFLMDEKRRFSNLGWLETFEKICRWFNFF